MSNRNDMHSQSYGFSNYHGQMSELDHKEGQSLENWCFQIVMLEKMLESPLYCKEIKPVNPKRNQSWLFIGRTVAKAEALVLGHVMWKADLLEKSQMLGKLKTKGEGLAEEMVRRHQWRNGHEFEQILGDSGGQRNLMCYSPLGHKK